MPPKIDLTKLPMLEVARLYVAAGYSVIPLTYLPGDEDASKRPALRALAQVGSTTTKKSGKVVGSWRPYQSRLPTDEELVAWFGSRTRRNIGIVTGAISGNIVFIDIDSKVIYKDWAEAYPHIAGLAPTQETRKGYHVGVRMMVTPPSNQNLYYKGEHVGESRGEGGYIIVCPSAHGSGFPYRWLRSLLDDQPPVISSLTEIGFTGKPPKKKTTKTFVMPHLSANTTSDFEQQFIRVQVEKALVELRQAPEGMRNTTLNRVAYTVGGWVAGGFITRADAERQLTEIARQIGLEETEIESTIESGLAAAPPFYVPDLARLKEGKPVDGIMLQHLLAQADDASEPTRADILYKITTIAAQSDAATIGRIAELVKQAGLATKTDFRRSVDDMKKEMVNLAKAVFKKTATEIDSWPYFVEEDRIVLRQFGGIGEVVTTVVANFSARIVAEIRSETGDKTWFRIAGKTIYGREFEIEISSEEFASNARLVAALTAAAGARTPVMARMETHLRPALQLLSGEVKTLVRYERTGWAAGHFLIPGREPENAIIHLPGKLPYSLAGETDLTKGLQVLDHLIQAVDVQAALVALMVAFQPQLAEPAGWSNDRNAIFITGRTGSFKSAWARAVMCIWGDFHLSRYMIKWGEGATRNAVMGLGRHAAHMPLLIDNYKPNTGGGAGDFITLLHNFLEGSDRDRLNRDSAVMDSAPIDAWLFSTGEDVPGTDAATLARLLVVYFGSSEQDTNPNLTKAQRGLLILRAVGRAWLDFLESEAGREVARFVGEYMPGRRDEWIAFLNKSNPNGANHRRVATSLAVNQLTFWVLTQVPDEFGTFFDRFADEHQAGLTAVAKQMTVSTAEALEIYRFLDALRALLNSERCALQQISPVPDHTIEPDRLIGWYDGVGTYLSMELARNAVERLLGRDSLAGISNRAIYQQLEEQGLIASKGTDGRPTIVKRLSGKPQRVLHLKPEVLQAG